MLIIEDGTAVINAESYISVEDADIYHLKLDNQQWLPPSLPTDLEYVRKEASLRKAAIYLDSYAIARGVGGVKMKPDQGLLFPLKGCVDIFGNAISGVPKVYVHAQCEVALAAFTGVKLFTSIPAGPLLKRKKIDVLEKEWFEGSYGQKFVFGWLDDMLAGLFGVPVADGELVIAQVNRA